MESYSKYCSCLASFLLNIMFSRFIHLVGWCICSSSFFVVESYSTVRCMDLSQFVSPFSYWWTFGWASLIAQLVKNPPAMQGTLVWFMGQEDPLKKGKATHSSIMAWRTPWTLCMVHGVAKSWTWLSNFHIHFPAFCQNWQPLSLSLLSAPTPS